MWLPIELTQEKKHRINLRRTYDIAGFFSRDPITNSGALLVSSDLSQTVSFGANRFPDGLNPALDQLEDRSWKYKNIIHAEQDAIFSAAKRGKSTYRAVMYEPWLACTPCAKAIITSGIKTIIGHKQLIEETPERWREDIGYATDLLKKAGVKVLAYDGLIGAKPIKFDGRVYYP